MSTTAPEPTATGLASNVAAALSYALGPLTGVLFLVLEQENRFVRFHFQGREWALPIVGRYARQHASPAA